jgi:hypothetical protein
MLLLNFAKSDKGEYSFVTQIGDNSDEKTVQKVKTGSLPVEIENAIESVQLTVERIYCASDEVHLLGVAVTYDKDMNATAVIESCLKINGEFVKAKTLNPIVFRKLDLVAPAHQNAEQLTQFRKIEARNDFYSAMLNLQEAVHANWHELFKAPEYEESLFGKEEMMALKSLKGNLLVSSARVKAYAEND